LSVIGDRLAKSGVKDLLLKNFISELASFFYDRCQALVLSIYAMYQRSLKTSQIPHI
jgi:hypothetical protein